MAQAKKKHKPCALHEMGKDCAVCGPPTMEQPKLKKTRIKCIHGRRWQYDVALAPGTTCKCCGLVFSFSGIPPEFCQDCRSPDKFIPNNAYPNAEMWKRKEDKLDLGCGPNKREGFIGVDRREFPGVDRIVDLTTTPWPWPDNSVEEVYCSHFLEHLDHNAHNPQRVRFMNELYRVMKVGGKATIITPHWCSNRAYGDFTHADKPVSEMFYYYLSKEWRKMNAPDNDVEWNPDGYSCDFAATWGYSMRPDLAIRNQEYQQFAFANYKEACQDLWCTLIKL
jgi:hypothetical protein